MARAGRRFLLAPTRPVVRGPSSLFDSTKLAFPTAQITSTTGVVEILYTLDLATATISGSAVIPSLSTAAGLALHIETGQLSSSAPTIPVSSSGSVSEEFVLEVALGDEELEMLISDASLLVGGIIEVVSNLISPGDRLLAPIQIFDSGSHAWNWGAYATYAEDASFSPVGDRSIWFSYKPATSGTTIFSGTGGGSLYAFDPLVVNSPLTWEPLGNTLLDGSTLDLGMLSAGRLIYLRLIPADASPTAASLTWTFTSVPTEFSLAAQPNVIPQTPSSVRLTLIGADDGVVVDFYHVGTVGSLLQETCDTTGQILGVSVPLPAISAGTHRMRAVTAAGEITETTIQVTANPPTYPTTVTADLPPIALPQGAVVKWSLQDPAPSGELFEFPFNPEEMDPPHPERSITVETTVASDGQPILWEGGQAAWEWGFKGYTDSQDVYEALERFRDLNHRFWLVDHRGRGWVVSFTSITWTSRRSPDRGNWSYDYEVSVIIYKGPVTPV